MVRISHPASRRKPAHAAATGKTLSQQETAVSVSPRNEAVSAGGIPASSDIAGGCPSKGASVWPCQYADGSTVRCGASAPSQGSEGQGSTTGVATCCRRFRAYLARRAPAVLTAFPHAWPSCVAASAATPATRPTYRAAHRVMRVDACFSAAIA